MRDAVRFFKALSDEARLKTLWLLLNHQELCVCDISTALGITQSKASRHLATLRHAGLVDVRKDGLWSHYSLRVPGDAVAGPHLALLRRTLNDCADAPALLATLAGWSHSKQRRLTCDKANVGNKAKNPGKVPRSSSRRTR
jgi:DNA-binding transcriptional ArsR family regulator